MELPKQRIRIVAGSPLEVGERRLLPSVLVNTVEGGSGTSRFRMTKLRPVSVVEQGPDGARWHEIPNETAHTLSVMTAIGLAIAGVSIIIIVLAHLLRRR